MAQSMKINQCYTKLTKRKKHFIITINSEKDLTKFDNFEWNNSLEGNYGSSIERKCLNIKELNRKSDN